MAIALGKTAGFCPVCRRYTVFGSWNRNLRESGVCARCGAFGRQRQIAAIVHHIFGQDRRFTTLSDNELTIFNTETRGSLHRQLIRGSHSQYIASEYLGPDVLPGECVGGIRHEDVQNLSFPTSTLDLVISSDVWEHVPKPYLAHSEVMRVLKPGGHHVFTVPFLQTDVLDDVRAVTDEKGNVILLKPPIYHSDPMSSEGALVYTFFSLQMIVKLNELGYDITMHRLYSPWAGILGNNALVFDARKPDDESEPGHIGAA